MNAVVVRVGKGVGLLNGLDISAHDGLGDAQPGRRGGGGRPQRVQQHKYKKEAEGRGQERVKR